MWNVFENLKQATFPIYLGVDIGTTSIKAVEVKQGEKLPELLNYGMLELGGYLLRANNALQTSTLKIFEEEVAELLKVLMAKMKLRAKEVVASIPAFAAFTTVLDFPAMTPEELKKTIAFQAKEYIPQPLSEVAIDWLKVGEFEDKGYKHDQILIISVPREQIKRYQRLFGMAGLTLRALEIESLSLARILTMGDPTPTIIADIGSRSTSIAFAARGELRYVGQSDFAGASLTQALAQGLNINPLRAEELKRERGIAQAGQSYELSTIMLPFLDAIINEVKKAQFNYGNQFPGAPQPERVILTGGGANLAGITGYMEKELGFPVVKSMPFMRFEHSAELEPMVGEVGPMLAVAMGLTMREFV
ncbi:MAG: type IV pilus assembly protein PilM [Candidatus Liptonbacteria bacterium]|nr:type IV pilus assembly protein PilM [Candidatus Liptonbacteria bacterium]